MKSFTRVKKINGQEYLYEITPYYDKEKKKIRQKSKYLGKNVNGVPVKVRSVDQMPKKVLSHGEFVPLKKIAEDLELEEVLSGVLPGKEVWPILTLAMNFATRPRALTHIHGSSVKEFKLHNIAIFHTNYASSRFDPISRLTCCSLFDQANLTVLATEIAASLRFFS